MQPARSTTSSFAAGLFVILSLAGLGLGLFLIGDRRNLFDDSIEMVSSFSRLSGLREGATVRVGGLDAGEVLAIMAPTKPGEPFTVQFDLRSDLLPIVRSDSEVRVETEGLLGDRYLSVLPGTADGDSVAAGTLLVGEEPLEVGDVIRKLDDLIPAAIEAIESAQQQVSAVGQSAAATMATAQKELTRISDSSSEITAEIRFILEGVREGEGTLGLLLTDDSLYLGARDLLQGVEKTSTEFSEVARSADSLIRSLESGDGEVKGVLAELQETLEISQEVLSDMSENTESLKRNWFFKRMFKERGFYDLDSLTVGDYRAGMLETKDGRVISAWLAAEEIFAAEPQEDEQLSDDGRRRIDRAMADFLDFPTENPLVVEGYSTEGDRSEQFVRSRRRARLVRSYILSRFDRDPNYTGLLAMGAPTEADPDDVGTEGVRLSLFVDDAQVSGSKVVAGDGKPVF